jgi:hypothetical protein
MTGKKLSRRTLLRGLGTAIALPALDAMRPAFSASRLTGSHNRMVFCYVPNGIIMEDWKPAVTGTGYDFLPIMKPLEPHRKKMSVLTGLTHNTGRALGDGPGDHARAAATFLTGVHPKKTAGADISLGISIDQVAAQSIGNRTRFASLELGLEGGRQAGNCDSGYSCAYSNNLSWRSPNTPNPPEINPRVVFERMFGNADPNETPAARARRRQYQKSILDLVQEDSARLQRELGSTDRRKMDEYMTAVRDIEQRLDKAEKAAEEIDLARIAPGLEKPMGIPVDFGEHARLMFDLMTIALQTGMTRIVTFMMAREGSNRSYREIGITDGHHGLTHHRDNQDWIGKIKQINRYHVDQFAYFLKKLDSIQDGEGTLLDNSMILYGSSIADGNRHTHHDLPILLCGGGAGKLRPGRHVQYPFHTPLTNLYLTMLEHMDVPTASLGDSTGRLNHVSEI